MNKQCIAWLVASCCFILVHTANALTRGIYLTQNSVSSLSQLKKYVHHAKEVGINTFVIDLKHPSKNYLRGVRYLHQQHMPFVTRVVVFPNGGSRQQVRNHNYWQARWQLIHYAIAHHSSGIQLDYIRYHDRMPSNKKNSLDIRNIVKYFYNKINHRVPLEIDIFGMVAHKPLHHIGQDARLLAPYVDAMCPMVYPSHYPAGYNKPSQAYHTVLRSLKALKRQLRGSNVKIYAYIEVYSYRYRMGFARRVRYINDEIRAVKDAGVDGWYAWSPRNRYQALYRALGR